jgi:hypothetical protein
MCIHSFIQQNLLNACFVSGTVLGEYSSELERQKYPWNGGVAQAVEHLFCT